MPNSADQLIYKAAQLLDENGNAEEAIVVLREAIALSEVAQHQLQLLRARVFLGELLFEMERHEEARPELEQVLRIAANFGEDPDLIDEEVATARSLLSQLDSD
jgi:tetratricopeptide (TPR) repeat protein